jgi:hypothetical protein
MAISWGIQYLGIEYPHGLDNIMGYHGDIMGIILPN